MKLSIEYVIVVDIYMLNSFNRHVKKEKINKIFKESIFRYNFNQEESISADFVFERVFYNTVYKY